MLTFDRGGNRASMQIFLIISTCFLYLVAAGLFSKAVWAFEMNSWNKVIGGDAADIGSGPGSYDIRQSVWHVNGANPEINGGGGWGIFNSILGWENSATYGSVLAYNFYWIAVMVAFILMTFHEKHGRWPLMRSREVAKDSTSSETDSLQADSVVEKGTTVTKTQPTVHSLDLNQA